MSQVGASRYVACTIVARNYTAFAKVLELSFRANNPGIDFVTLVIDGAPEHLGEPLGRVLLLDDLALPAEDLEPMVVMYSVMELATALKPALLLTLLSEGYEAAAYFDPDIWVVGDLGHVFDVTAESGIALTPHTLRPIPRDGLEIPEKTIMHAGIFNLGFIGVAPGASEFLEWWHERLRTEAVVDFGNALFTDQRWIDWVPALFDHTVLRHPGLNVAYWNLHERRLERLADGRLLAGGAPLGFIHFSGFSVRTPWLLSRFMGEEPRVLIGDQPVLEELCIAYAEALEQHGHSQHQVTPYGHERVGSVRLVHEMRRVYRDVVRGDLHLGTPPSRPVTEADALTEWFRTPAQCVPWVRFTPTDIALWRSRPDLQALFPVPLGASSHGYREWLDHDSTARKFYEGTGVAAPDPDDVRVHQDKTLVSGWSVVACGAPEPSGDTREIARRAAGEVASAGVPVEFVHPPRGRGSDGLWQHEGLNVSSIHENVLICVDAQHFAPDVILQALAGRHGRCIALWLSDSVVVSDTEARYLALFDEIWTLSRATERALVERTTVPVRAVHLPTPPLPAASRGDGLDWLAAARGDGPVVLLPLDAKGDFDLQNPAASVRAYRAAQPTEGARLIVHVNHGTLSRRQVETIRHAVGDRKDVRVVYDSLTDGAAQRVIGAVDAVISLHRASAYNVALADATAAGTPVVTTWFGGPATYTDGATAVIVPHSLVARQGFGASPEEDLVAEPDEEAAARALRAALLDRRGGERKARLAADRFGHERDGISDVVVSMTLNIGRSTP